jgi:hypothetical protein
MATEHSRSDVHACACLACRQHPHGTVARQHRSLNRLVAISDERTRRLFVGFLAQQHGLGGTAYYARITGLDPDTIARGLRELRQHLPKPGSRLRQPGAGRPRAEKKVRAS